ncbi:MAG: carboxypeptidase regulatory-like domain-containing protein [Acidobacteriota bacterium]
MRFYKIAALLALLLASARLGHAQERFGGLSGVVTDSSQAAVPGATITITNKQSGAVRSAVSGAEGAYSVPDLEPGRYTVVIELSGFQKVSNDDVLVLLGRTFTVNAQLTVGNVSETVNVTAAEKQIDLKSVTISHNVTSEELDRLPKARSFTGIALTSPSVNQGDIEGGLQVNGASGAENSFTVDGVVTNSLVNGKSRQDTVFEYLQEVQVKTGGANAEFGGALGGVISAVTKSGGNVFHGEGHYYFDGSPVSAAQIQRLVLSPTDDKTVSFVQDDKQRNIRNEVGGSIGGPIAKDRLFFFGSVSPRIIRRTNNYGFSSGTEPGSIDQSQTLGQYFGKVSYTSSHVQANISGLMTPTRSTGTLSAFNGATVNGISSSLASNASQAVRGWKQDQNNVAGNVDIWLSSTAYLSVRGGYFYDNFGDTGIPTTTSVTYNTSAVGVPGVPAALQLPLGTQNTPRSLITNFDTTKRGFMQLDYNHTFNAAGTHQLKGGYGYQHTLNDVDSAYPGGFILLNWGRTFTSLVAGGGGTGTYGYYELDNRGTVGQAGSNINSLFVQDSWTPTPRLTLNLGVRSEHEVVPSFRDGINAFEFGFGQKVAPRLGATYDVRGDGKIKLYGSWGKYFDWTKYDLPRGSYGGDIYQVYYRSLDTLDINSLNINNKPGRDLWDPATPNSFRDRRVPNFDSTDPNIKPMYQTSTNFGIEFQANQTSVVGIHFVHNYLDRTIEDMGGLDAKGNETYIIGNPGEGLGVLTPTTGLTKPFATPKPIRQYDAMELTYSRRFSNNWFASASYTLSRLYGNYAGLANSDEILTPTTGTSSTTTQQQAGSISRQGGNAGRAWDLDEVLADSRGNLDGVVGRLATDRPNVVKLYGAYSFPMGTQLGLFFYGGSGTPISTYVNTTNTIPMFVYGRGDMGRTPVLTRTDLLISHEFSMMQSKKLRLELNVINLFNQKTATHLFNNLNRGAGTARASSAIDLSKVDLAQGFDVTKAILATSDGANAYDPRYGQADLWQTGTQGQLSVKFIF